MNQIITYIIVVLSGFLWIGSNLNINTINQNIQNKNISQTISMIYHNINLENPKCSVQISGANIYISWYCDHESLDANLKTEVQKNIYTVVDQLWPSIIWRSSGYDQIATTFDYTGSIPIFAKDDKFDLYNYDDDLAKSIYILSKYSDKKIYIPIYDIKSQISKKYISWYVANRDIALYSQCQKQNFDVAMQKLQSIKLSSWQKLNINKELTNLSWYCMGGESSNGKYMFYQWVCGTSTLFFRNALINPYIYITKRQWHSNRFTKYYGNYIYGDDAAIYEMDKQFEIQNKSDYDIYIKFWTLGDIYKDSNKHLVSIYPSLSNKIVNITKMEWPNLAGKFAASVTKNIYIKNSLTWINISDHSISWLSQTRISNYYDKMYDTN